MGARGPLEADTCRDTVLPALRAAGRGDEQIREQLAITDGRIVPARGRHRRTRGRRSDYVLEVRPGAAVAVVEAKRAFKLPSDGPARVR